MFPVYAPLRVCRSGVGCRKVMLRPEAVRMIRSEGIEAVGVVPRSVAGV